MLKIRSQAWWVPALGVLALALTIALVLVLVFTPQLQTLTATPPPVPGDDWPTYLHDVQRTGASNGEVTLSPANAGQLTRLWAFKTGDGISAQPAIVNNTVYIGSWDGYEYALDAVTGFQKWKTYLGKTHGRCVPPVIGINSSATVIDDTVYVGGGDAYWYALNAFTGAVKWRVFTGDNSPDKGYYNWASPLIYKNHAYIGVASNCDNPLVPGQLLRVSLDSHKVDGKFMFVDPREVGGGIWTSPSVDTATNTIFVTTGTQNQIWQKLSQALVSLDADTMKMKGVWQIPLSQSGGDFDWGNTPVLMTDAAGHKLVAGTNKNGFTYAFKRDDISAGPVWEAQTGLGGECPPCGQGSVSSGTFANGTLYMAGGNTVINGVGYAGALRAIDPGTGKYKWEHGVPEPIIPAIIYANGLIIDGAGQVMEVLDASNGKRLYAFESTQGFYGAPAVSHGQIFMGSLDGYVYSFGLRNHQTPPADAQCPGGWTCQDIGNPRTQGAESMGQGTWSIAGNGQGVADVSDQLRFVHQSVDGDIQLSARVLSVPPGNASALAGIFLRQNTDRGAPFYGVFVNAKNVATVQYRTGFNGAVTTAGKINNANLLRSIAIQRIGDKLRASTSTDGKNYTLIPGSTITLVMPDTVRAGLAATSGINGVAAAANFSDVTFAEPSVAPSAPGSSGACLNGWSCSDIGNPTLVGDQTVNNGVWSFKGAGKDIWRDNDQFHFAWQGLPGNSTVTAHITAVSNTDPQAKAGVMLRTDASADALYYGAFITPGTGLTVQYRRVRGLNADIVTNNTAFKAPHYLRVTRWKNIFSTYVSPDGKNWTALGGSSVPMDITGPMLGGIALSSHKINALNNATFDTVSTEAQSIPAPTACPDQWACADIGYPSPLGTQLYHATNSSWTLEGGGFDIYFKTDQFHYVWQSITRDGSISARVNYVNDGGIDGNDYAKAGVMLRKDKSETSPYYAALLTPQHGVMVQYRKQNGAGTGEALLPDPYKGAVYLKLERVGTHYTALVSKDGAAWTVVDGSGVDIDMGQNVMAGMAVTSHNPGAVRIVSFDDVVIQ